MAIRFPGGFVHSFRYVISYFVAISNSGIQKKMPQWFPTLKMHFLRTVITP